MVRGGSTFAIKYEKGKEVRAKKGTIGILAFTTLHYASDFLSEFNDHNQFTVIRIRPTSPVSVKRKVCSINHDQSASEALEEYYDGAKIDRTWFHTDAWKGTVVCDSAKVLS